MGLVVPPIRTRDSIERPPSTYVIRIAGVEAGRGIAPAGRVLALGEAIDPLLEQSMLEGLRPSELGTQIIIDQYALASLLGSVRDVVSRVEGTGLSAVLVCAPALRPAIRRLISAQSGGLPVLSYQEVTSANVNIETVGVVRGAESISA